jgi:ketosteroid isomerase-like protein
MTINFNDSTKQEIWKTVRAMNDAWTKGDPDDLARFFHRDMVAITPSDRNRLDGGEACIAGWKGFSSAARIHRWEEIDPAIQIYGDSAVITYYFDMSFEMNGQTFDMGGRDMFFFVKEDGRWWAVADQFSSFPA